MSAPMEPSAPDSPKRLSTVSPRRATLGRLARGSALNGLGAAVAAIANFALVVVVTRGLSTAGAGVFFVVTSLFLLVSMAAKVGTPTALVYFLSRMRALDTPAKMRDYLIVAIPPVIGVALLLSAALFVTAPQLAPLIAAGVEDGGVTRYIRTLAVFLPLAAVLDACLGATRGFGTMRPTALIDSIGRPLAQLLLVSLAVSLTGGALVATAWAGPYLLALVIACVWLARLHHQRLENDTLPTAAPAYRETAREFWRYSTPRSVGRVVQLALQRLDILLVGALLGPAQAAIYAAATRFFVVGQLANRAIYQATQPHLGVLLARGERAEAGRVYQTSTAWLMLTAWPLYLSLAALSPWIMGIFGDTYQSGVKVLVILAVAMLAATASGVVDVVLNMAGYTTRTMLNALLALALMVTFDLVLIPEYGIMGAAIGWSVAIVARNLAGLTQAYLALGLHPYARSTLTAAVLAGMCFGVVPLTLRATTAGVLPVGVALAAGAVVYVFACWHHRTSLQLDAWSAIRPGRRITQERGET